MTARKANATARPAIARRDAAKPPVPPVQKGAVREKSWEVPSFTVQEFARRRTKYCVCIPVINEGSRIRAQLLRMKHLAAKADIIIADGGSTDNSLEPSLLKNSGVHTLLVKTGAGRLSAQMRMALAYAMQEGYAGFIFIDGNNKDDPSAIPLFIKALDDGFDHVQGSRFVKGGKAINTPFLRYWPLRLIHAPAISLSAGTTYTDTSNGFRAYSKRLIADKRVKPFRNVFSEYELHYYLAIRAAELGFAVKEVPVTRTYPKGKVPTKLSVVRGNTKILRTLVNACLHKYDPK